jgi:hypothetical protein
VESVAYFAPSHVHYLLQTLEYDRPSPWHEAAGVRRRQKFDQCMEEGSQDETLNDLFDVMRRLGK